MADPKPLLKKGGKLAKRDGKLLRTDNPAACPCCGDCKCPRVPARIGNVRLVPDPDTTKIRVTYDVAWNPDQDCDVKYDFEFEYYTLDGNLLGKSNTPAEVGTSTHYHIDNLDEACDNIALRTHKVRVRVIDLAGQCQPGEWSEDFVSTWPDICPPPEDCACFVPPDIVAVRLEREEGKDVCLTITVEWNPPCWEDGELVNRASLRVDGHFTDNDDMEPYWQNIVGGTATKGRRSYRVCFPKGSICQQQLRPEFFKARIEDNLRLCPPTAWSPWRGIAADSPTYDDICGPGDCCCIYAFEATPGDAAAPWLCPDGWDLDWNPLIMGLGVKPYCTKREVIVCDDGCPGIVGSPVPYDQIVVPAPCPTPVPVDYWCCKDGAPLFQWPSTDVAGTPAFLAQCQGDGGQVYPTFDGNPPADCQLPPDHNPLP